MNPSGLLLFHLKRKETLLMGNKSNTEIKVLTFYDGEAEAIDAFADVIRYKMRQRILERKKLKITSGTSGNAVVEEYNRGEILEYPEPAPRLCG